MNYEELLGSQEGVAIHREELPMGTFYKKLIDRKYRNVLELKPSLTDNLVFCEGLRTDQRQTSAIVARGQLHYELHSDSSGIYELETEQGNYQTMAQLIDNTPAVVANPGYVDQTIATLFEVTAQLHEHSIYHLCYAPQNIFVRKPDNAPLLLCHGSSFAAMSDLPSLYEGFEAYVAPEVLRGEGMGESSDVYSLGRFIEWFFLHGDIPYEYKHVVACATQDDPSRRYQSVADMQAALAHRRTMKHSFLSLLAAVAVALLCVGLYFELVPQTEDIEFVEPAPREATDDLLDDGFDPETELGLWVDSIDTLSAAERAQMDEYMRKAEDIFRRQYRREADRIMSKVYTKEGMSLSENIFVQLTSTMTEELTKAQQRLAGDAGISDDRAVRIAAEVNEELSAEKQRRLRLNGYQKPEQDGDDH